MTAPGMTPLPNLICPLCGGSNECAPAKAGNFDVECWCKSATISPEALQAIPADLINKACLCPRCAGLVPEPQEAAAPKDRGARP